MKIGDRQFDTANRTYIMGIMNMTPDSFFDGGKYNSIDAALYKCEEMIEDGADIIDVGGESTRPGYTIIPDREEADRVCGIITDLRRRFDVPISCDTYKSYVAKLALEAGADIINDIWGLKYSSEMAGVIAAANACVCIMHNRKNAEYSNFFEDMKSDLRESIAISRAAGIADSRVILDPGVGFAKSTEQNLEAIGRIGELNSLGFPLLLGVSNKSVIGNVLDLPKDLRMEGTLATTVIAALKGCAFVRVHAVKENKHALKICEAIRKYC